MADPVLTLGDLEPDRPTVAITRSVPASRWEAFRIRHLPATLRLVAPRLTRRRELYALRHPSEFSLEDVGRIQAHQREIRELQASTDPAAVSRAERLLRELSGIILEAPAEVLDELSASENLQILLVFPSTVMGQIPTPPAATENPLTSGASSLASATSTARTTG